MIKKLFCFALLITVFSATCVFAQNTNNPGYFQSPGFIGLGGSQVYNNSDTHRDKDIRPFLLGVYNIVQSEYGNVALSFGSIFITPSRTLVEDDFSFKISAQQYTGELGLNYMTGSKSFNIWMGAGYNINYVSGKIRNVVNTNGYESPYTKQFNQTVYGWHYYLGGEYVLTKDGKWGIFFLFRGQETTRAKFDNDVLLSFDDLSTAHMSGQSTLDLNNKTYILGLAYHF